MLEQLPKVLIIGPNVMNPQVGAGVALSGLFGGWPQGRLAQIHSDTTEPDRNVCTRYFRLNEGEILVGPIVTRQLARLAQFLAGRIEESAYIFGRPTRRLLAWTDAFSPELIFSQLGGLPMTQITLALAERYQVPLAIHISDDWVGRWPMNVLGRRVPPITGIANVRMQNAFRRAVNRAQLRLAIGEKMATEYKRRYGPDFLPFYNAVDPSDWPDVPRRTHQNGLIRVVYSGSIFRYAQHRSLRDISDAIAELNTQGSRFRLDIYSQHWRKPDVERAFGNLSHVRLAGLVPREMLRDNLVQADFLVLPVNFDEDTLEFIRLSVPGKLAEYLSSGTPVLVYGPPEAAQVQSAIERKWGMVVERREPAQLRDAIARIGTDRTIRTALTKQARFIAHRYFNLPIQRARFEESLTALVRQE